MAKKQLPLMPRVTEPDEGKVHYAPALGLDQVTLCGLTDFIGATSGQETTEPVNCYPCQAIADYFKTHRTE